MRQTHTRHFTMVCSLVALCMAIAGCSSSGKLPAPSNGLTRSPQPPVYADNDRDTLAELLAGGEAVFAPQSAAIRRHAGAKDAGVTHLEPGAAYVSSIAGDGAGGFDVTYVIEGREIPLRFTAGDKNQDSGYPGIRHYFSVPSRSDDALYFWPWTRLVNGEPEFDYLDLFGWSYADPQARIHGFAAFGMRTPVPELPLGRASHEGKMQATIWDADEPRWGHQRSLQGTVNLEASFDDGQIEGRISDLRMGSIFSDEASHTPLPGENWIDISSAEIGEEGRFTAEWVGNGPQNGVLAGFAGTLIGELYGPSGEETGGVLSGRRDAVGDLPEQFLVGGFGASQLDE